MRTAAWHLPDVIGGYQLPTGAQFSKQKQTLDPAIFTATEQMWPDIRDWCLSETNSFWQPRYGNWWEWAKLYLAGSSASYWWSGDNDLDLLIGVSSYKFARAHPEMADLARDQQALCAHFNDEFRAEFNGTVVVHQAPQGDGKWQAQDPEQQPQDKIARWLGSIVKRGGLTHGSEGVLELLFQRSNSGWTRLGSNALKEVTAAVTNHGYVEIAGTRCPRCRPEVPIVITHVNAVPVNDVICGGYTSGGNTTSPLRTTSACGATRMVVAPYVKSQKKASSSTKCYKLTTATVSDELEDCSVIPATSMLIVLSDGLAPMCRRCSTILPEARWWDVSLYANPYSYDIRAIKPYAAYSISDDRWAVHPTKLPRNFSAKAMPRGFWESVGKMADHIKTILAQPEPGRTQDATELLEELHHGRQLAYSGIGSGVFDQRQIMWLALERLGVLQDLIIAVHPEGTPHPKPAVP
jgi:hypothetical protein